ncbi:unnamed protein product [Cylindrotheca closterium]|uniref:Tyrosine specific protein phosphatases domain-containing protein n=1 Tax=Cylindrotheca closterium TaxID=2856 RepID=A0AAD2CLX2_9STRA|nr:unnamed protein product [Cylindrotheca closterium]
MIENFRQAVGLGNVFRSATTDVLGGTDVSQLEGSDKFVAEKMGLILDLRFKHEIDDPAAQKWLAEQGIQWIESADSYSAIEKRRTAIRISVLSMDYIDKHWSSPAEQQKAADVQPEEVTQLRIEKLNERGLFGLNQLILESGGVGICKTLMIITRRFEANADDVILIECVQGKDRTGMLVMLLQALTEFSDDVIIDDYIASDNMAIKALGERDYSGGLDHEIFSGATKEAMVSTLDYLRQKYGSISPGYFDHIGFNNIWRRRLRCCLKVTQASTDSRMYW